jgi:CRP/FNR family cyclic AMP-dependent transcriptional regulator
MPETLSSPTLPSFSWIGHLKEDDRDLLSSYGEFFPGHPGNVIITEGVLQTEVFVVISGKLEVRAKQEDGSEIVLAQVGPGETLGEISLFVPGPAAATVTAVEFSQLWRIADSDLMHFMEENPGAGNILLRTLASILAQRLRQLNPRVFGLSAYAVVDSPELAKEAPDVEEDEVEEVSEPFVTAAPEPVATLPPPEPIPAPPVAPEPRRSPIPPQPFYGRGVSTKTQIIPDPDELDEKIEG